MIIMVVTKVTKMIMKLTFAKITMAITLNIMKCYDAKIYSK